MLKNPLFGDFQPSKCVTQETMCKYSNLLPDELIVAWGNYGFGSFLHGYLKMIDPDEYVDIFNISYFRAKKSIPIFTTGLGDIISWEENRYLRLVKYRTGSFYGISAGFEFFFSDLQDKSFCDRHLDWKQYLSAVSVKGIPDYNECFGYVPLLGLGGSEKVENLMTVKTLEHIMLINELIGPIT